MFKAQDGYVLIGSDFSQQEPMVTAHLSNDKKMQEAFINGKDIYATIAALAFHKPYEECKEFRDDGTVNPAGKERRTQAKSIVLGRQNNMPLYSVMSIANYVNPITQGCVA